MDDVGIPIHQAVRPMSRSLTVSQGKGVTPMHSRVSAVMESFEVFHAEDPQLPAIHATSHELRADLPYDPHDLQLRTPTLFHDGLINEWLPARVLGNGAETFVPAGVVNMDSTVDGTLQPVVFHCNTNGLASGNTHSEAIAHALYEIIERECHANARDLGDEGIRRIDPLSITGEGGDLVAKFHAAEAIVEVRNVTSSLLVPCFQTSVWSPTYQVLCFGAGCHADPQVAVCRALTEAAQSRVTCISGMREDIETDVWSFLQRHIVEQPRPSDREMDTFDEVTSPWASESMEEDVDHLCTAVTSHTGVPPIVVTLTRRDLEIPVVKVVCPSMPVYMP
jgi:ribosomal protein S12 methylthiotransferase accessory factor